MPSKGTITFANVIVHFGQKNLLDYFNEIVFPALTDEDLVRRHRRGGDFFFRDCRLTVVSEDPLVLAVSGRFIRNVLLEREQVIKGGKLVHDEASLESAPSSFFLFVLNDHKIVFLGETDFAPDQRAFSSTFRFFLKQKYKEFISKQQADYKNPLNTRISKAALRDSHAAPEVQVVPLSSESSIREFIDQFARLTAVKFRLLEPNDDIDPAEIYNGLRQQRKSLKATEVDVAFKGANGISKSEAAEEVETATAGGNVIVSLSGVDSEGAAIRGNNESFKMKVDAEDVPVQRKRRERAMLDTLRQHVPSASAAQAANAKKVEPLAPQKRD